MYFSRYLEDVIKSVNSSFKVLYLGGPRQVGKTTLLKHLAGKFKMNYVTFDDLRVRKLAKDDPELFLEINPAPLLIDEVQYVPQLFSYIKIRVDASDKTGRYWLTGSHQFSVLKDIQESLAGRVGILNLLGFSRAEENLARKRNKPFDLEHSNEVKITEKFS
ncbi:AAA family ATPase, partial [Candidatus Peregrinibacteria bacterium]|nr:AAA family ATPase [Candidatus Peregrinibacteria bacterium]